MTNPESMTGRVTVTFRKSPRRSNYEHRFLYVIRYQDAERPLDPNVQWCGQACISVLDPKTGEYRLVNVQPLKVFPPIEFWVEKKGQKNLLILDDVDLTHLSTRGDPCQRILCDRTLGYVSTHMNLTVYVMNQTWVGAPPFVRKLCTHFILYPNRLDRASIPYISKGVMLHKDTLRQLFDACVEPYDFLLITLKPDGRAMVRINGHRAVRNVMG